jgi:hypothetical protein
MGAQFTLLCGATERAWSVVSNVKRQEDHWWTGRDLRETVDVKMPKVVVRNRGTSWWWGQCALLKRRSTSTRLHGAKSQKAAVIFNTTKNHRQGSPSPDRDSKYAQTLNFNLAAWEPEISHLTAMLTPSAQTQWLVSPGDLIGYSHTITFSELLLKTFCLRAHSVSICFFLDNSVQLSTC